MEIAWEKITKEERKKFYKIVDKVVKHDKSLDYTHTLMDLEATHLNSPLDLEKMLKADRFNLLHDVYGIARHLDRDTGELMNCFSPRCSLSEKEALIMRYNNLTEYLN